MVWGRWSVHPWRDPAGRVTGIVLFSEDVSDHVRDRERRLEAERRYRALIDASPDAIILLSGERIEYVNPSGVQLLGGVTVDELLGRSMWDFVLPSQRSRVADRLVLVREGVEVTRSLVGLRQLHGAVRDVEVSSSLVPGGEARVQAIVRDVTDELQVRRALAEEQGRLAAIVRSALDGIITIEQDQTIVVANSAAERMFGRGSLLGRSLSDLLPERYRGSHEGLVEAFGRTSELRRQMASNRTVFALRANGEEFPIEASISKAGAGGKLLFTVILRDISDRRRAIEALEAQERRFRDLAESISEVFWLASIVDGSLLYVSPAYEALWGRTVASLYEDPKSWFRAIHPDDRGRVAESRRAFGAAPSDAYYRVEHPDGTVRWVHDRWFPIVEDGVVTRVAGVAEDVTEKRLLEEQVRQTQRLESIGLLAGGIAHDFNNLLTVIISAGEMLGEEDLPAEARDLAADALEAGLAGASLTRQLLAFSRQEVLEPRVVDLGDVVAEAEKLLRRIIGEDVRLVTERAPSGGWVHVDPGQWSQVIVNLAVNARDAMPDGGRLTITTRPVTVDPHDPRHPDLGPGGYVALEVADTGSGMPPDVCARIFEPFFTTKGMGKGTGLGLAVVYGVVRQAGGSIHVESEVGVGTQFSVLVPAATVAAAPTPSRRPRRGARGHETILFVEDDPAVRAIASRALGGLGYELLVASDGPSALALLDEHSVRLDLLVTDVILPEMTGPALADEVLARHPSAAVLFCSGYMDDALARTGVRSSGAAFLQKPFTPTTLTARIRKILDGDGG